MKTITIRAFKVTLPSSLVYRLVTLANVLELPCREIYSRQVINHDPILDQAFKEDGDKFLQDTIAECLNKLEAIRLDLVRTRETVKIYKYVEEHHGPAVDKALEKLNSIANSSPLAIIELYLLFHYTSNLTQLIPHLIPWFIRYGEEEDITNHEIISRLQHVYYRDYVARLPSDSLHQYLLSDNPHERVMAVNKYRMETETE